MTEPPADVNQPRYGILGLNDLRSDLDARHPGERLRCDPRLVIALLERIPPGKRVTLPCKSVLHLIYSGDAE